MSTLAIARSWRRTRRAMRLSPAGLEAHRATQWRALQPSLARTPATAALARQPLSSHPITEPSAIRADYGRWNCLGLIDTDLRSLADGDIVPSAPPGLSAGWSTGTAGTRGLFVATPAERADYIGQSLARLLPPAALLRRQRLALVLRAGNALYSDVRRGRFAFLHLPLDVSDTDLADRLAAFAPTILIAPPARLLALAPGTLPSLRHLFYGSEPMSAAERDAAAARLGLRPRAIYQATEGFLGADCAAGRLHLNEHALEIEREPVAGTPGFRPIITDLRRCSQPIVRVRLDDYLEADDAPCPCGYSGQVVRPVAGRVRDLWRWPDRVVTPGQVQEVVEGALGADRRYLAEADRHGVTLRVQGDAPPDGTEAAASALAVLTNRPVETATGWSPPAGPKRRKVVWRDG